MSEQRVRIIKSTKDNHYYAVVFKGVRADTDDVDYALDLGTDASVVPKVLQILKDLGGKDSPSMTN